jgi:hypothetical protein
MDDQAQSECGKLGFFQRIRRDVSAGAEARREAKSLRTANASTHEEAAQREADQLQQTATLGELILDKGRQGEFPAEADALDAMGKTLAKSEKDHQEQTQRGETAASEIERITAELTPLIEKAIATHKAAQSAHRDAEASHKAAAKAEKANQHLVESLRKKLSAAESNADGPDAAAIESLTAELASADLAHSPLAQAESVARVAAADAAKHQDDTKSAVHAAKVQLADAIKPHHAAKKEAATKASERNTEIQLLQADRVKVIAQLGQAGLAKDWDDDDLRAMAEAHAAQAESLLALHSQATGRQEQIDALTPAVRALYLWVGMMAATLLIAVVLVLWIVSLF